MRTLLSTTAAAMIAAAAHADTVTLEDRNGRTVEVKSNPELVLCLLNRCAEEMAAIGIPLDKLAFGRPWTYNVALNPVNYGEAARDVRTILADDETDWEAAAALEPDLIIVQMSRLEVAEQIAPVYTLSWDDRDSDDAWVHDARAYAKLFGVEDRVEAQIGAMLDRVAAYDALAPGDRSMMLLNLTSDDEIAIVNNCDFYITQVATCFSGPEGRGQQIVSVEYLLEADPDVIILEDYNQNVDANGVSDRERRLEALGDNPLWNELSAVKAGNVHNVPVSQAKPNSVGSIVPTFDTLLPLVYPDAFPAALTDDEVAAALSN